MKWAIFGVVVFVIFIIMLNAADIDVEEDRRKLRKAIRKLSGDKEL